jgi:hypothetical protein
MGRGPIEVYRCLSCHRLINSHQIRTKGSCKCGGKKLNGTSPVGFFEHVQCAWWALILP